MHQFQSCLSCNRPFAVNKVIFTARSYGGKVGGSNAGGGKVAGWRQSLAAKLGGVARISGRQLRRNRSATVQSVNSVSSVSQFSSVVARISGSQLRRNRSATVQSVSQFKNDRAFGAGFSVSCDMFLYLRESIIRTQLGSLRLVSCLSNDSEGIRSLGGKVGGWLTSHRPTGLPAVAKLQVAE